jgi:hypothetical protein
VAGCVEDIDFVFAAVEVGVPYGAVFAENGDSPFPLNGVGIHNQAILATGQFVQFGIAEHSGLIEQPIDQGCFAVVNVCDNRNISNISGRRHLFLYPYKKIGIDGQTG